MYELVWLIDIFHIFLTIHYVTLHELDKRFVKRNSDTFRYYKSMLDANKNKKINNFYQNFF